MNGLRVGKGAIGFSFSDNAVDQPRRLNWHITTELLRISSVSLRADLLATKMRYVATQEAAKIRGQRFIVGGEPTFYEVRISFSTRTGTVLGRYSEYFRVVRPKFSSRLTLSTGSIAAGRSLLFRVENQGTESILPNSRSFIERHEQGGWVGVESVVTPGLRPQIRELLFGGGASRCVSYQVPADQPAGRYRIINKITRTMGSARGQQEILADEFEVITGD